MILIGIDENGLAPLLGPLVTTATVFNYPSNQNEYCLWKKYSQTISKKRKNYPEKIIVNDSKKIFKAGSPEESYHIISNTAEAFTPENGAIPEYLGRVSISLTPLKFNRQINKYGSKTILNLACFLELINRVMKKNLSGEKYKIYCDKIGATRKYTAKIQKLSLFKNSFWNNSKIKVISENRASSHYRIEMQNETEIELIFSTNSDQANFSVALASVIGKYIRELYMRQFNNYFQKLDPNLPITSGYPNKNTYQFIKESEKIRKRLKIPTEAIIRTK